MDKRIFKQRINRVEEINELIFILKRAYLKSLYPNLSKKEIEERLNRWRGKTHF